MLPKKTLNPENLLSRLSEEAIFRAFINTPFTLGKKISSPLRKDTEPSFVVWQGKSRMLYHDFALGSTGDCFQLVKELYSCNFNEALKIIATKFGVDEDFNITKLREGITKTTISPTVNTKQEKVVKNLFYKFYYDGNYLFEEELSYYAQYGITRNILQNYKVARIKEVARDVIKNEVEVREIYDFSKTPAYLYNAIKLSEKGELVKGGFKVHKPFDKNRFLSFCDSQTLFYSPYLFEKSEGLNHFYLFITKSMKDSMCLSALGFHSLAIQGESVKPETVKDIIFKCVEELIKLGNLKKDFKLVLLFDNDEAGVKCSERFLTFFEKLNMDKTIQLFVYKDYGKDISDFIKSTHLNYVKNKLLDMLM
jgi:hypothetical protein